MKTKSIVIKNNSIQCEYQKRKNSKNVKVRIDNSGIVKVSLPIYAPYKFAESFVNKNLSWIEQKLNLLTLRKNKYYYLGHNIRLIKKSDANYKGFNYILKEDALLVEFSEGSFSDDELYYRWLKDKATEYIPKRVKELAVKHNFKYNSIKIKNLKSRWGSCSIKKNLSFNLKLMYFNYKVIDYVIIHELCHLKEMNHSKKFWDLVEGIVPEYKAHRKQLNKIIHI